MQGISDVGSQEGFVLICLGRFTGDVNKRDIIQGKGEELCNKPENS